MVLPRQDYDNKFKFVCQPPIKYFCVDMIVYITTSDLIIPPTPGRSRGACCLDIAANFFNDTITEDNFNLHFTNQVITWFDTEKAFHLKLVDFLI
jgi:hypothetical protein